MGDFGRFWGYLLDGPPDRQSLQVPETPVDVEEAWSRLLTAWVLWDAELLVAKVSLSSPQVNGNILLFEEPRWSTDVGDGWLQALQARF